MDKRKLYNYFRSTFELTESSNGWYRLDNPFEIKGGKTMAVNFGYGCILCHRSGYKSSIIDFLRIYSDKSYSELYSVVDKYTEVSFRVSRVVSKSIKSVDLPHHFHLFGEGALLEDRAKTYLENRGFHMDLITERSIGFCNDGDWVGRIIIPFMNPTLKYYIGRSFIGHGLKYKNPKKIEVGIGKSELFYNEEALRGDRIYLVEGVFDALTCGDRGVASLGWKLSDYQINALKTCNADIYIIPDKGFYGKALITAKTLLPKNVFITSLDFFDGNDINDLGSIDNLKFKKVSWVTV